MRTVRQFFTGLFSKKEKSKNLKTQGDYIPKKVETKSKKEVKKAEKLQERAWYKAHRNGNKSYATTKSFNDRSNDFRHDPPKQKKDPNAETYLKLSRKHYLKNLNLEKPKKFMTYTEWIELKLKKVA